MEPILLTEEQQSRVCWLYNTQKPPITQRDLTVLVAAINKVREQS